MVRARPPGLFEPIMSDYRATLRGILAMLACCLFFVINDTLVKLAGATLPLGQILFLRGLLATAAIGLIAWRIGALQSFASHFKLFVGLRTFGEVAATLLYLTALLHLPSANASAIAQTVPLVITAAGALFLGERVGPRRWAAVVIGFLGVILIVRPGGDGFNVYALLALASVLAIALRDVSTRMIPSQTPTLFVTFVATAAVTVIGGALSLSEDWGSVGNIEVGYIAGSALFVLLGYYFSIIAMRSGDVSLVAPFRYAFIPYAIVIGIFVFGDIPDAITMIGIAIVLATGAYTFWRERQRQRLLAAAIPAPL